MDSCRRRPSRWLLVAGTFLGWPLLAAPPLEQLPGTAACVSETGSSGSCADGVGLDNPTAVAVSPDGRNVYATTSASDAVAVFDRNPLTGELTQKAGTAACVSETGSSGDCADGVALEGADFLVVSPDGRSVYVAAEDSNAVAVFDRDLETGELTQLAATAACVSETGTGGECTDGVALDNVVDVRVSPDGRNVYVIASASGAIAVFDRDLATGALTQKGGTDACVSNTGSGGACQDGVALGSAREAAVSPDGRNVYVVAISSAIAVFDRDVATGELTQKAGTDGCVSEDGTSGSCVDGVALQSVNGLTISPDGRHVYASSFAGDSIAIFDRNLATGVLTQKGGTAACVSESGTGGACTVVSVLNGPDALVVSPRGDSLLVSSFSTGLQVFDREISSGALSQHEGVAACVSFAGSGGLCRVGVAVNAPLGLAVTPEGRHVYGASSQADAVVAFDAVPPAYDVDGDGEIDPLSDSILLLRAAFGFTGATLVTGAVDLANCVRCTAEVIESYIKAHGEV